MYYQRSANKYGAKKTEYNGRNYDSKLEAGVAQDLDLLLKTGEIVNIEPQYKVTVTVYRSDGRAAFTVNHKVDFRVENKDGSFKLIEAKGYPTDDWKWRRRLLEEIWLPEHLDHTYEVWTKPRVYYR